jgi:putative MATE family efflux protein
MKRSYEIDMSEGKLFGKLVSFAIPLLLSGLLQLAFNAADLIVVGRFAGELSLAAVGSNGALVALILNVLMGLGTGTNILVSRYFGAKNEKALLDAVQTTVIVAIIGGVIFGIAGILISGLLLQAMGTPETVLPLAKLYLRIYFCGLPIMILYNFSSAVLRAVGDSRRPLYFLSIAGVLNVGMNLIFVIVFHMGVAGVAIATVMSQCVSCVLTLRCLIKSKTICRLVLRPLRFSWTAFKEIIRIGLPAGIQGSLFSISNVLIQSSINYFGDMTMAGNAAAANIEAFLFVSMDAMNQSAVASVSQNMGARKYPRTRSAVRTCLLMEFIVATVLGGITVLFRRQLVGIYTSEEAAIAAGCIRIIILGVAYFTNGMQHMMTGVMRGLGYSILPTCITLAGICGFRVVYIYTYFAAHKTLEVLYASYPISWVLTIAAQLICYFTLRNRAYRRNEEKFVKRLAEQSAGN